MRLETTYKHQRLPGAASFYFNLERDRFDKRFHKRRQRRASRHVANLDTKRAALEEISFQEFEKDQYNLSEFNIDFDSQYDDFLEYEPPDERDEYEERARKWEEENYRSEYDPNYDYNEDW